MSTFQAVINSIVHGFAEFLPVDVSAHHTFLSYIFDWNYPPQILAGVMTAASLLALLIYFRHDWASIISSLLQVIIFRRKPMTLDERLPFFLLISTIPVAAARFYWGQEIIKWAQHPMWVAVSLAAFGLPLWGSDSFNRRMKSMFDWNWLDALFVGIFQVLILMPGCGRMTAAVIASSLRHYHRDAALKFAFLAAAPVLLLDAITRLQGLDFSKASADPHVSWLTLGVTFVATTLAALLAIDSFMKYIQRKGFAGYVVYRWVLALGILLIFWLRSQNVIA